jgi:hypothetical protein
LGESGVLTWSESTPLEVEKKLVYSLSTESSVYVPPRMSQQPQKTETHFKFPWVWKGWARAGENPTKYDSKFFGKKPVPKNLGPETPEPDYDAFQEVTFRVFQLNIKVKLF